MKREAQWDNLILHLKRARILASCGGVNDELLSSVIDVALHVCVEHYEVFQPCRLDLIEVDDGPIEFVEEECGYGCGPLELPF